MASFTPAFASDISALEKLNSIFKLLKFRLSLTVAFSAGIGFMLGSNESNNYNGLFLLMTAGLLVTFSSNIVNQVYEKRTDALMKRTAKRPIPLGLISMKEAILLALLFFIAGISLMLFYFNIKTALLAMLSWALYGMVYTPMKFMSPVAVFIGAFPGAFPPMIGWVAATNSFGLEPGILFAIQFVWQFPHFWAIAWVLDKDYRKAGIKLLPSGGKRDIHTAFKIMIYTMLLIPLGFIPNLLGMTGINSAFIALVCGVLFLCQTFYLMKKCNDKAAKLIMFGSFLYLPIVQIAFLWDKL